MASSVRFNMSGLSQNVRLRGLLCIGWFYQWPVTLILVPAGFVCLYRSTSIESAWDSGYPDGCISSAFGLGRG